MPSFPFSCVWYLPGGTYSRKSPCTIDPHWRPLYHHRLQRLQRREKVLQMKRTNSTTSQTILELIGTKLLLIKNESRKRKPSDNASLSTEVSQQPFPPSGTR